jgi:hypothetical protein
MDAIKCGKHPDRKYDCTNEKNARKLRPVTRQELKTSQHLWYTGEDEYISYEPFLVRVIAIDDSQMEFKFLDCRTGEDLDNLSSLTYKIAYNNPRYAWADPPSTAHRVLPSDLQGKEPRSCGLLFIAHKYMKSDGFVKEADYDAITLIGGGGDGKWPIAAGAQPGRHEIAGHVGRLDADLQNIPPEYRASLEVTLNKLKALI